MALARPEGAIFTLAHVVEEADFPLPDPATNRLQNHWAVHQVQTTVDFARRNRVRRVVKSKSMATEEIHLNAALEREGIETKVFALDPQRPNLVARLRGSGKKRPG